MYKFDEEKYELAIIEFFTDSLGYEHIYAPNLERDAYDVLLMDKLRESLKCINKEANILAIDEAIYKIKNLGSGSLVSKNMAFHKFLTRGVDVSYFVDGENKSDHIKLIDTKNIQNNSFVICNQMTIKENGTYRPDLIIYINGLPLVNIELKSCSRENVDVSEAFRQIETYKRTIPSLYCYNSFVMISDMSETHVGTITASESRFVSWKSVDGTLESKNFIDFKTPLEGMFGKERIIDIISNFIMYVQAKDEEPTKVLAGYHQYFAVKKSLEATVNAKGNSGKIGVVWHTQGSGKSYTMVFYTAMLTKLLGNLTFVVLTDRNDLDDQLYGTFNCTKEHINQTPTQVTSRADLKDKLTNIKVGGVYFTTMQKFAEETGLLSNRDDIVVIADEAHRSQYGLDSKVDKNTGKIRYGFAHYVRESLPNASFIGFTGTPIDNTDKSTIEIFGYYIDVYDMTQAVFDGATRPIYYESRVIKLNLDQNVLQQIDDEYDLIAEEAENYHIDKSKKDLGSMSALFGASEVVETFCIDMLNHYEQRKDLVVGKAMIVAYNRQIAVDIYEKLVSLKPELEEQLCIVMTTNNSDPEKWQKLASKKELKEKERQFKDPNGKLKICIVVDMWLTGFDVPSLDTMYIYKHMKAHTLMQAIARVNRVYGDKEGGIVVDYVGIAGALEKAMRDYTLRDQEQNSQNKVDVAYKIVQEKIDICHSLMYRFDYSDFLIDTEKITNLKRAELISDGINHIIACNERKLDFQKEAQALHKAGKLCRSMIKKDENFKMAYFEAVRTSVNKVTGLGKINVKEINERISEIMKNAIATDGVINLFDNLPEFSIFNEEHLKKISQMKQKNLAAELLIKILRDELKIFRRQNLVKSVEFSKRMEILLNQYNNGHITNAEVIEELIKLAETMTLEDSESIKLGLTKEEKAFYDAIKIPEDRNKFNDDKVLSEMAKEITSLIRTNKTLDWHKKENVRSEMRRLVKRLLKKHKYPPENYEYALETVLEQVKVSAENDFY